MIKAGLLHSDGSRFNPERFKRDLMKSVMNAADAKVKDSLRTIHCPVHFQTPSVTRTATGWDVRGCCQTLIDAVKARLAK